MPFTFQIGVEIDDCTETNHKTKEAPEADELAPDGDEPVKAEVLEEARLLVDEGDDEDQPDAARLMTSVLSRLVRGSIGIAAAELWALTDDGMARALLHRVDGGFYCSKVARAAAAESAAASAAIAALAATDPAAARFEGEALQLETIPSVGLAGVLFNTAEEQSTPPMDSSKHGLMDGSKHEGRGADGADGAAATAEENLHAKKRRRASYASVFAELDVDGGGTLDAEELREGLGRLGQPVTADEAEKMVGRVERPETPVASARARGRGAPALDRSPDHYVFLLFENNDGDLSSSSLSPRCKRRTRTVTAASTSTSSPRRLSGCVPRVAAGSSATSPRPCLRRTGLPSRYAHRLTSPPGLTSSRGERRYDSFNLRRAMI